MSTYQQYTVAPRQGSTSLQEMQQILESVPGVRVTQLDAKNRLAVIEVPEHLLQQVRGKLDDRFLVDPNAPLRY